MAVIHNERRVNHGFKWTKATSNGSPWLWLKVESGSQFENDVFLVNDSTEVLSVVRAGSNGLFTSEDAVVNLEDNNDTRYTNVQPAEAVLVDRFHDIYDLDFLLFLTLSIDSPAFGKLELTTSLEKGRIAEQVLMSEGLTFAKGLNVQKIESN